MTHIKDQPALHLLLLYSMTYSVIYFRRWVMLSGTSITATLISPLGSLRQYKSRMSPKRRPGRGSTPCLPDAFWAFQLHWELLVVLEFFFFFLNTKFVWSELSSSPQGASLPLVLTFSPSLVLTTFISCLHMHSPNLPQDFYWGWNLQLQKRAPPPPSVFALSNSPQFALYKWLLPSL